MTNKTITQQRHERDLAAIRAAKYRKNRANRPDVRAVDKSMCEAISIYSRTLPPEAAKAFLEAMVDLASAGLEFRGYGPKSSRKRAALRLAGWVSPTPTSGSVRAAVDRKAIREAMAQRDAITAQ